MAQTPRILALAGSVRRDSFNRKLLPIVAQGARMAGAEVTILDLKDYPLPLFDQDLEAAQGLPDSAKKLKELFKQHHGLILASPEYNSSITPLMKNTIDWVSRPEPQEPSLAAYQGKIAALVSASPGALGGLRGLQHLRSILSNIGVLVLADQWAIAKAHEAFNEAGGLKDAKMQSNLEQLGQRLATMLHKLNS